MLALLIYIMHNFRLWFPVLHLSHEMSEEEIKNKMNTKKKKKKVAEAEVLPWQEQKKTADMEEATVRKEVDELISWTAMIEVMDDNQLKEYVLKRPDSLQSVRKGKDAPKKIRRNGKVRPSSPSSLGIMATVWKFHKEDDGEASTADQVDGETNQAPF